MEQVSRDKTWLGVLGTLAALLSLGVCACRGFWELFSTVSVWDDTGYMLSLFEEFNRLGHLYKLVFSQYGPAFSQFYYLVGAVGHVPLTQDGIRWFVLFLWLLTSVCAGWFSFLCMRNLLLAAACQLCVFHVLSPLHYEPGHPLSLVVIGLGLLLVVIGRWEKNRGALIWTFALGALAGVLLLVKINLGIFTLAALGAALIYASPRDTVGVTLRLIVGSLLCLLPLAVVRESWGLEVRIPFVVTAMVSVVSVLLCGQATELDWKAVRRVGVGFIGGLFFTTVVSLSAALLTGSSGRDLLGGILLGPLRLARLFWIEPNHDFGHGSENAALTALFLALGWRWLAAKSRVSAWINLGLRLLFLYLLATRALLPGEAAISLAPFLWITVLRDRDEPISRSDIARFACALLAAVHLLGVYPVAGSQTAIPLFLMTVCAIFPARDILLSPVLQEARLATTAMVSMTVAIVVFALAVGNSFVLAKERARAVYRNGVPLGLPGAALTRTDPLSAANYRAVSINLERSRPTFLSVPGLNSFYSFARRPYPTGFNATMNFALLTPAEQEAVVAVARGCAPFAALTNRQIESIWTHGPEVDESPLRRFARSCPVVASFGGYQLRQLPGGSPPLVTYCATVSGSPDNGGITLTVPNNIERPQSARLIDATAAEKSPAKADLSPWRAHGELDGDYELLIPDELRQTVRRSPRRFLVRLCRQDHSTIADIPFVSLP